MSEASEMLTANYMAQCPDVVRVSQMLGLLENITIYLKITWMKSIRFLSVCIQVIVLDPLPVHPFDTKVIP